MEGTGMGQENADEKQPAVEEARCAPVKEEAVGEEMEIAVVAGLQFRAMSHRSRQSRQNDVRRTERQHEMTLC